MARSAMEPHDGGPHRPSSPARILGMNVSELPTIARVAVDSLEVFVFENRALAGRAAAQGVAPEIAARQQTGGRLNLVFAAARSQHEILAGLAAHAESRWSRGDACHLDQYL